MLEPDASGATPPGELINVISRSVSTDRPAIVAAVSGGSDSTALLLLLKDFIKRTANAPRLVAVTVDHGLRSESADEAKAVAQLAARLGVEHRTLRWSGPKPATGIAAAAREARYRLLAQAATDAGTDTVFTAHTADDQAETVFMRRQRGDGMGLAGMAPATLFDGKAWIVRPLLETRREVLRVFLKSNSTGWIDDPSNVDRRSERARVRAGLAGPKGATSDVEALLDLARISAENRKNTGGAAARLVSQFVRQAEPGLIFADPAFATADDRPAAIIALRVLLAVAGGSAQLPDEARTEHLLAQLANPPFRATLSRCLVVARRDGVWLARELRDLPAPQSVRGGMIWDGRFRVVADGSAEASIAAAGDEAAREGEDSRNAPALALRAALAARPVVTGGSAPGPAAIPVAGPYARFLPSFDIELVRAVSALVGASPISDPPCSGHNVRQA
ncbi:tRNA lysidine(34) synthetase TilS [Mesorhizobium sp. ASY16-5R]|uniref:tRNA lysidine(34) synthetase TilS n=1 Tax=Mesorhizobium sp. ASY16-5R TaxID=3445772 RepID=UPI003F9F5699